MNMEAVALVPPRTIECTLEATVAGDIQKSPWAAVPGVVTSCLSVMTALYCCSKIRPSDLP